MKTIKKRRGFSLIEVIAAVVILAVVATTTVATIAPMRKKSQFKMDDQQIARLQGIVQTYYLENGAYPNANMTQLYSGTGQLYLDERPKTPFGGFYRYDAATNTVVNPQRPAN